MCLLLEEQRDKELKGLASQFSKHIQDGMFSPAELQGFLLTRKNDPYKACNDIDNWVKEESRKPAKSQFLFPIKRSIEVHIGASKVLDGNYLKMRTVS